MPGRASFPAVNRHRNSKALQGNASLAALIDLVSGLSSFSSKYTQNLNLLSSCCLGGLPTHKVPSITPQGSFSWGSFGYSQEAVKTPSFCLVTWCRAASRLHLQECLVSLGLLILPQLASQCSPVDPRGSQKCSHIRELRQSAVTGAAAAWEEWEPLGRTILQPRRVPQSCHEGTAVPFAGWKVRCCERAGERLWQPGVRLLPDFQCCTSLAMGTAKEPLQLDHWFCTPGKPSD